jgi:hypothetical protein
VGIAITAVLLYILIAEFGGISASDNRWKILGLVAGVIVLEALTRAVADSWLISLVAVAVVAAILAMALVLWLKVERIAALKVAGLFFSIRLALAFVMSWLFAA